MGRDHVQERVHGGFTACLDPAGEIHQERSVSKGPRRAGNRPPKRRGPLLQQPRSVAIDVGLDAVRCVPEQRQIQQSGRRAVEVGAVAAVRSRNSVFNGVLGAGERSAGMIAEVGMHDPRSRFATCRQLRHRQLLLRGRHEDLSILLDGARHHERTRHWPNAGVERLGQSLGHDAADLRRFVALLGWRCLGWHRFSQSARPARHLPSKTKARNNSRSTRRCRRRGRLRARVSATVGPPRAMVKERSR